MAGQKVKSVTKTGHISPWVLPLSAIFVLVVGFLFIRPYFSAILFSALISFTFNPLYKYFLRKTNRPGLSVASTLGVATLAVILPCILLAIMTFNQISNMVSTYQSGSVSFGSASLNSVVATGTDRVQAIVNTLPGGKGVDIDKQAVQEKVKTGLLDALDALANAIGHFGTAIFGFIATFILSLFLIASMLRYQDELIGLLKRISPFDNTINTLYLRRVALMTKAMVKGQFIIAATQGLAATFSLWVVGIDYFVFFFILLTFASFIPLGAGIVTIPIGVVLILTGNVWQGVFIILWQLFFVSLIDNFMRPYLVNKDAYLNAGLMMLAVFSGLALFGILGIVYGPVIMILLVTTIRIYAEHNGKRERVGLLAESEFGGATTPAAPKSKHFASVKKLLKRTPAK